jgi:hypothetical protein
VYDTEPVRTGLPGKMGVFARYTRTYEPKAVGIHARHILMYNLSVMPAWFVVEVSVGKLGSQLKEERLEEL